MLYGKSSKLHLQFVLCNLCSYEFYKKCLDMCFIETVETLLCG